MTARVDSTRSASWLHCGYPQRTPAIRTDSRRGSSRRRARVVVGRPFLRRSGRDAPPGERHDHTGRGRHARLGLPPAVLGLACSARLAASVGACGVGRLVVVFAFVPVVPVVSTHQFSPCQGGRRQAAFRDYIPARRYPPRRSRDELVPFDGPPAWTRALRRSTRGYALGRSLPALRRGRRWKRNESIARSSSMRCGLSNCSRRAQLGREPEIRHVFVELHAGAVDQHRRRTVSRRPSSNGSEPVLGTSTAAEPLCRHVS